MKIQLSDHFSYGKLFRFTFPSIVMMIFTSVYGVVDGLFVSNYLGKTPFAAVNFIFPFIMVLGAFGFLFGTGGSALVSKTMGMGDMEKANRLFSMLSYISMAVGVLLSVLGMLFIRPLAAWLGAEGELLELCVLYGRILLIGNPFFMLQVQFQSFFITAEKPKLGLVDSLIAGFAIFGSSFFTALNNGPVSAAISFLRTVVFQTAAILLLPLLWAVDGIWISIVIAEMMATVVFLIFMMLLRKRYCY